MNRPTIADLARAAGVSVSTVNRILGGSGSVRPATIQRVQDAAGEIGFYGVGVIDARKKEAMPHYRLAFLLQQSHRDLYQLFAQKIREAARQRRDEEVEPVIEFVDRLEPEHIAARLKALGDDCDAVAVIAADHPLIGQAIQALKAEGKPVVAYITDQSAPDRAGYVGTDNWKLGRTAAWFIAKTTHGPGRVAVFIGNHRYQCQDIADASFRSYIRENASSPDRRGQPPDARGAEGGLPDRFRAAPGDGRPGRHLHHRRRDLGRAAGPAGSAGEAPLGQPDLSGHRP